MLPRWCCGNQLQDGRLSLEACTTHGTKAGVCGQALAFALACTVAQDGSGQAPAKVAQGVRVSGAAAGIGCGGLVDAGKGAARLIEALGLFPLALLM